jgi:hypothetical protein
MMAISAFLQSPLGTLALMAIGYGFREGVAFILKSKRTAALAGVAQAAADAVSAGVAAGPGGKQAAVNAAMTSLRQNTPAIFNSLEAEADVLLAGHVAQMTAITPGNAVVTLPTLKGA